MFKKLLVPLDGTPESAAALPLARAVARATAAELALLRVVPPWLPGTPEPASVQASAYLEKVGRELRADGHPVDVAVRDGEAPAEVIVDEVRARGVDLIVMATHGRGGLERAVVGSVTTQVLATSPVPLLALRPGGQRVARIRTLLVPVDGTPGGSLALGAAVGLARAAGARIVLLRVAVPLPLWVYEPTLGLDTGPLIDPRWNEDARASAQTYVDSLARRLRESGVEADGQALLGTPAEAITRAAEQVAADIVVMSTHAHTGPARAMLGSVADAVVRTSRHPVLLMRRGRSAQEDVEHDLGTPPAAEAAGPP